MIAIRNYQNDIFFSLFSNSSCYYKRDYSYNTLLHYAAAYGNMEIVKYLLEMGMNQTMNRKSFYPFEIAILKGHISCAKLLENWNLHFSHHLLNRILKNPRGTNEFYEIF
jgi:ankyrin repeat protein